MSKTYNLKTYNLLADSFTEIINDYKNNDGKNLTHDQISIIEEKNQIQERSHLSHH